MNISATRLADGATLATIGLGTALTIAPSQAAAVLGLGPHHRRARAIGIADLTLGALLLTRRSRRRWMTVRAAFNAIIAACYVDEVRRTGSTRARIGAAGMTALTIVDGGVACALRSDDTN